MFNLDLLNIREEYYILKHGKPVFRTIRNAVFEKYHNLTVARCSNNEILIGVFNNSHPHVHAIMTISEDGTPYYFVTSTMSGKLNSVGFNDPKKFLEHMFDGLDEFSESFKK